MFLSVSYRCSKLGPRSPGPLHYQVPGEAFDQQLAHGKKAALDLFDVHKHHLGDTAFAAKKREELTEELIAQDAQHRSRYRVDWVRFPVLTTSRRLLLVDCRMPVVFPVFAWTCCIV